MRYILDSEGYIEETIFGGMIDCNNNSCTEYTGSIPSGYTSLEEWNDNANIRAYKIEGVNLVYDSERDAKLQALWQTQEANNKSEIVGNKVTAISSVNTDTQYPSARAVYNALSEVSGTGGTGGTDLPIGTGMDYFGTTAPSNYMFADGSAISRTDYAELFAIIGTTYGNGDGSTTFNLPDKREAVTIMKGTTYGTLGASVGGNTKTIAKANLPDYTLYSASHTHTFTGTASSHSHNAYYANYRMESTTSHTNIARPFSSTDSSTYSVSSTSITPKGTNSGTTITVKSGGSGTALNVMQKTLVCNYIIKVK